MKRDPEARYCDEHGIVVHRTHDLEVATRLAYAYELERRGYKPGDELPEVDRFELPAPIQTWLRVRPALPGERDAYGYTYWYDPGTPGRSGTFAAVEFPDEGRPMGVRARQLDLGSGDDQSNR